jgi:cysteine desulfuration protein SufE
VWIHPEVKEGRFDFQGDSDAMIVRGLIALLHTLYSGLPPAEAAQVDAKAELTRLGLEENLSSQRSNGLRAMIQRLKESSAAAAA